MKKYMYNCPYFSFFLYDNDIDDLKDYLSDFNFEYDIEFKNCNSITLSLYDPGSEINIKLCFKYTERYFRYCYEYTGEYYSNKYKGSRKFIKQLFEILGNHYYIVTKKEEIRCCVCDEVIGWKYNDFGDIYDSITPKDDLLDENLLYEPYEIFKCDDCGEFYCYFDGIADIDTHICDNCIEKYDDRTENEKISDEDDYIKYWNSYCKYENSDYIPICRYCEEYETCLDLANDSRTGYEMFCDCIVGHGYDSMEEFWEHSI